MRAPLKKESALRWMAREKYQLARPFVQNSGRDRFSDFWQETILFRLLAGDHFCSDFWQETVCSDFWQETILFHLLAGDRLFRLLAGDRFVPIWQETVSNFLAGDHVSIWQETLY